jgi:hypothetical protein
LSIPLRERKINEAHHSVSSRNVHKSFGSACGREILS